MMDRRIITMLAALAGECRTEMQGILSGLEGLSDGELRHVGTEAGKVKAGAQAGVAFCQRVR